MLFQMTTPCLRKFFALAVAGFLCQGLFGGKRPNFLFIIVDDQSPLISRYTTPDRFSTRPISTASPRKAWCWTEPTTWEPGWGSLHAFAPHGDVGTHGLHVPDKPGRVMNPHVTNPKKVPPDLAQYTLPAVFNRAGYDTMRTCKNGNSYEAANKLFTVRHDGTRRGGTDETGSHWHGEQVMNYLKERETSKDKDPFLIYYGFSHPHDVRDGKPVLLAKYGAVNHLDQENLPPANPKQPPLPIGWLPGHPFDHGHTTVRDEVGVKGVWKKRDERTIRNEMGANSPAARTSTFRSGGY